MNRIVFSNICYLNTLVDVLSNQVLITFNFFFFICVSFSNFSHSPVPLSTLLQILVRCLFCSSFVLVFLPLHSSYTYFCVLFPTLILLSSSGVNDLGNVTLTHSLQSVTLLFLLLKIFLLHQRSFFLHNFSPSPVPFSALLLIVPAQCLFHRI